MTINAMHPDALIMRHSNSGSTHLLSKIMNCCIINAGDGFHEHPTQALVDALTIIRHKGCIKNLNIAICGDIIHSRVARSNILLLNTFGAKVRIIAPPTLIPSGIEQMGVEVFHNMEKGLINCDIVMMLRLQFERMKGIFISSEREYFHLYGLNHQKLKYAKSDVLIMHPGPINRGIEIASELADDIKHSLIYQQVEIGVYVRMAILEIFLNNYKNIRGKI